MDPIYKIGWEKALELELERARPYCKVIKTHAVRTDGVAPVPTQHDREDLKRKVTEEWTDE